MIAIFMIVFQFSSGPVAWIYCSETTNEAGMGICFLTLWGTVFALSIVSPVVMDQSSLGPSITFLIFSGLQILGYLYVFIFIKETAGLSDREKKLLFTPKRYLE